MFRLFIEMNGITFSLWSKSGYEFSYIIYTIMPTEGGLDCRIMEGTGCLGI